MQYNDFAIRTCKFSHFKKHLVATSNDEGLIMIWDTQNLEIYHAFERYKHSKACYGVAYSPTNELLLCSAGLDKKI